MANRGVLGFENRICNGHFGSHSDSGFTTPNSLSNPSHPVFVKILSPNIFLGKNEMKNRKKLGNQMKLYGQIIMKDRTF